MTCKLAAGERVTYLQRELKRRAMMNSVDLRGSRRLSLMCDFIAKVLQILLMIVICCPSAKPGLLGKIEKMLSWLCARLL